MTSAPTTSGRDLRRAPLANLRSIDLRAGDRDFFADEQAVADRFEAAIAGLDDAAWRLPGAAPSDAGGPDWSLAEHVGHVADWQELAIEYVGTALEAGRWPSDQEYDGGDFDTFNERRREPWASMPAAAIRARLRESRSRLLPLVGRLGADAIRSDDAWGWIYLVLHGHRLDHLAVVEPWAARLRFRQADGDPFVDDPRPADHGAFFAADAVIAAQFDELVRPVPARAWTTEHLTPGWTLRDHVAHLADWAEEGQRAIDAYRRTGVWPSDPPEGIDAWNERQVARWRDATPGTVLERHDREMARLRDAVASLALDELRAPDGFSWAYDCLYGHVRKHLALVGPWCAASRWPGEGEDVRKGTGETRGER